MRACVSPWKTRRPEPRALAFFARLRLPRESAITRIRRRWKLRGLLLMGAVLAYVGIAQRVDWWLFHLHAHRAARDAAAVVAQARGTGLEVDTLGTVHQGKDAWPLLALHRRLADARGRLCVFAGVHGNEPAGVEAALGLARDLGRDPGLYPGVDVLVVPLVNPAGWTHDLRHNADNQDIARSFGHGGTPEATLLRRLLAREHCNVVVDLHEDRLRSATYLLSYGDGMALDVAKDLAQRIAAAGHAVDTDAVNAGKYHTAPTAYAGVERPTLSLYAQQQGVAQSFIVETPMRASMAERSAVHRLVLDALAQRITTLP